MNKVYFDQTWGFFLGNLNNNQFHQHYAVQLSIGISEKFNVFDHKNNLLSSDAALVKSNVIHQLVCPSDQLLFLFNPTSRIGHFLQSESKKNIVEYDHPIVKNLRKSALHYLQQKINFNQLIQNIQDDLFTLDCHCKNNLHISDSRIQNALEYLSENYNRTVPLAEIATQCYLSPSRFLHLFKEVTQITYRRAQLWNKISQSLPFLNKQSITTTAHQFGFADSAHYSRIFKQNFGFTPKFLSK